jgi:hypothetical protein
MDNVKGFKVDGSRFKPKRRFPVNREPLPAPTYRAGLSAGLSIEVLTKMEALAKAG